ncbi:MAG: hypothetical protein ABJ237_14045 [Parasphingorhabdus sp.]
MVAGLGLGSNGPYDYILTSDHVSSFSIWGGCGGIRGILSRAGHPL